MDIGVEDLYANGIDSSVEISYQFTINIQAPMLSYESGNSTID